MAAGQRLTVGWARAMLVRGAWANIKPMPGRVMALAFSACLYRYRDPIQRFFNKPKHFIAIATRSGKLDEPVI